MDMFFITKNVSKYFENTIFYKSVGYILFLLYFIRIFYSVLCRLLEQLLTMFHNCFKLMLD